jgi:hypothetical protein
MERIKYVSGWSDVSSHKGHGMGLWLMSRQEVSQNIDHRMNLGLKSIFGPKMSQNCKSLFVQANLRKSHKENKANLKSKV